MIPSLVIWCQIFQSGSKLCQNTTKPFWYLRIQYCWWTNIFLPIQQILTFQMSAKKTLVWSFELPRSNFDNFTNAFTMVNSPCNVLQHRWFLVSPNYIPWNINWGPVKDTNEWQKCPEPIKGIFFKMLSITSALWQQTLIIKQNIN